MTSRTSPRSRSPLAPRTALVAAALVMVAALGFLAWVPTTASSGSTTGSSEALGVGAGSLPDGTTVLAEGLPGIDRLQPQLRAALRAAAAEAAADGVAFHVSSGWRSAAYQQRLLDQAVTTYGSAAEAARWVSPPQRSAHVAGEAVDMGAAAADWLSRHGAAFGLCPVYGNEPWHFELRPSAPARGCPAVYADPTRDPRMRP